jgi:DNA-binding transcriptional LysR family regulator
MAAIVCSDEKYWRDSPAMSNFKNEHHLAWDDLRLVLAIARERSLIAAAERLGTSHPTVFRRARDLERRLGVRLFERARRGYTLTAAGDEIHAVALKMEQEVEALEQRLAGRDLKPAGPIRLTTVDTLICGPLVPLLARFRARHPEIVLDVTVAGALSNLSRRDADIALRAGGEPPEALIGRKLARIAVAIYRGRDTARVSASELDKAPWVMPDDTLSHLASVRWLEAKRLDRRAVLRANSLLTLAQAARHGIGLAILPCYLADADPMLARVCAPMSELGSDLWLLTQPELSKVTRVRAFMDALYEDIQPLKPLFEGKAAQASGLTI